MKIVAEPREVIAAWVGSRCGHGFRPPYSTLAAMRDDGQIVAAMVFNVWTDNDVEISVAADRILPPALLRAAWDYVVNDLGCVRATYRTREDNFKAQKLLEKLGAAREGYQRSYFEDCGALLYGIQKNEFPYCPKDQQ